MIFLPDGYKVIFFILAAAALVLPFFRIFEKWAGYITNFFYAKFFKSGYRYIYRLIFVLIMTILFIIFATRTHFLGDGYSLLSTIGSESISFSKWSELGAYWLVKSILSLFDYKDQDLVQLIYRIISVTSGLIVIWFLFSITGLITENALKRYLAFIALLLSGSLLLFFGYVENYPILWVSMCGIIYFGLRCLKHGVGITWFLLFLIAGIALHMQIAICLPAALYVIFIRAQKSKLSLESKYLLPIGLSIISLFLIAVLIYKYLTDLYFQNMLLSLFPSDQEKSYTIFGTSHIIDIVNELLLISPLFIFLLTFISIRGIDGLRKTCLIFLALISLGCLAFLFLVDPKLGMPKDWDLFSLCLFPPTLFLILLINEDKIYVLKKLLISISIFSTIAVLPYLIVNLNRNTACEYAEYLIKLDTDKSLASIYVLSLYYEDHGYKSKADSLRKIQSPNFTRKYQCDSATSLLNEGNIEGAISILDNMEPNIFDGYYQRVTSKIQYYQGNYGEAMESINRAIQMRRYYSDIYGDRAKIYIALGDNEEALKDLKHGYHLDNSSRYILDGLIDLCFRMQIYDSCVYYAGKRLIIDTNYWHAYFMIAKSYYMTGDLDSAQYYVDRCIEYIDEDSSYIRHPKELQRLINMRVR